MAAPYLEHLLVGVLQVEGRFMNQYRDAQSFEPGDYLVGIPRHHDQVGSVGGYGLQVGPEPAQVGHRGVLRIVGERIHSDDLASRPDRKQHLGSGG